VSTDRVSGLPNADMRAAPAALVRAARRAREIARQTGTAIVVIRDGRLIEEKPGEIQAPVDAGEPARS
jgi:hypothetical protein